MAQEKEVFFVEIEDTWQLKKQLLENSKLIISNLKRYITLKQIREQKKETLLALKNVIDELEMMLKDLNKLLPRKKTGRRIKEPEQKKKKKKKSRKKKKKLSPEEKYLESLSLEKLETELARIERKLDRLEEF